MVRSDQGKNSPDSNSQQYSLSKHGYITNNRVNVAITRAKNGIAMIVNPATFGCHPMVNEFLIQTISRGSFLRVMPNHDLVSDIQRMNPIPPIWIKPKSHLWMDNCFPDDPQPTDEIRNGDIYMPTRTMKIKRS